MLIFSNYLEIRQFRDRTLRVNPYVLIITNMKKCSSQVTPLGARGGKNLALLFLSGIFSYHSARTPVRPE